MGGYSLTSDNEAYVLGASTDDDAGTSLAFEEDANDDGYADLVIGAPHYSSSDHGAVYVVYGPVSGNYDLYTDYNVRLTGEVRGDECGRSVTWVGDTSGDGQLDLLIGCGADSAGGPEVGAAYLVYGNITTTGDMSLADAALLGESGSDYAGYTVGSGDLDGDGVPDLLVGAYGDDDGGSGAGAVYLLLGGGLFDRQGVDAGGRVMSGGGYGIWVPRRRRRGRVPGWTGG